MTAEDILINLAIGTFFLICGFIRGIKESRKTKQNLITINENLKKTNSNLEDKIRINTEATEHLGEETQQTITTLANEIAFLRKELQENKKSNDAKKLEPTNINKTDNAIKTIIEETKKVYTQIGIGTDSANTKQLCSTCREEMIDYGWKQTPWGLVWHYRCPRGHGIFPSTKLDDIWDE